MTDDEVLAARRLPPGPTLDMMVANEVMRLKLKPYHWCAAYSTSMEFAVEVLDKLKRRNKTIALRWWPPAEVPGHPDGVWTAHIGLGRYDVEGETLPHAICLAALASLYEKKPGKDGET